ncbi:hypothetical protein AVEN_75349-1, partial [Araneus ventricosus]
MNDAWLRVPKRLGFTFVKFANSDLYENLDPIGGKEDTHNPYLVFFSVMKHKLRHIG